MGGSMKVNGKEVYNDMGPGMRKAKPTQPKTSGIAQYAPVQVKEKAPIPTQYRVPDSPAPAPATTSSIASTTTTTAKPMVKPEDKGFASGIVKAKEALKGPAPSVASDLKKILEEY